MSKFILLDAGPLGMISHPRADKNRDILEWVTLMLQQGNSYGLLYLHDDESGRYGNEFRVRVLKSGSITECTDPFLSPYIPRVEAPSMGAS